MRTVREGPIAIFPREHGIVDVFTGRGWDHHSVFKLIRGNPRLIEGNPLTEREYAELKEYVK
jgi:hypothetical protein